jgi:hypothetical protein
VTESDNTTLAEECDKLTVELTALRPRLQAMRIRLDHYLGNLTFYGLAVNVLENAEGTRYLFEGGWTGAAYPCARAAFEAAEDLWLLITWDDYAVAGARARVFDQLDFLRVRRSFIESMQVSNAPPPRTYEEVGKEVLKQVSTIRKYSESQADHLLAAFTYFRPKFEAAEEGNARHPNHWSEMSRRKMALHIAARSEGNANFPEQFGSIYGLLSRATHPGLRPETWLRQRGPDGRMGLAISGRNQHAPATAARAAVALVNSAFEQHLENQASR